MQLLSKNEMSSSGSGMPNSFYLFFCLSPSTQRLKVSIKEELLGYTQVMIHYRPPVSICGFWNSSASLFCTLARMNNIPSHIVHVQQQPVAPCQTSYMARRSRLMLPVISKNSSTSEWLTESRDTSDVHGSSLIGKCSNASA